MRDCRLAGFVLTLILGCSVGGDNHTRGDAAGDPDVVRGDPSGAGDVAYEGGGCATGDAGCGWIEVIELAAPYLGSASWARAYFAHELHFAVWPERRADLRCQPALTEGSCTLYDRCVDFDRMCDPVCAPDEECGAVDFTCHRFTTPLDLGRIDLEGLKAPVALNPDTYGRYARNDLAEDIFDQGDGVTAHVEGSELGPFSISATGVAPLEIASSTVTLVAGQPFTLSWTAADPQSQVQTFVASGWHPPYAPLAVIRCESPDSDGQVTISRALVDGFRARGTLVNRLSHIMRYTQTIEARSGVGLEMTVGSFQFLELDLQ